MVGNVIDLGCNHIDSIVFESLGGVVLVSIYFFLFRVIPIQRHHYVLYRIIDTLQTTSVAAATWTYLIRHYGDPDADTKIYPYVYKLCMAFFFWSKFLLRLVLSLYVSDFVVLIDFLTYL